MKFPVFLVDAPAIIYQHFHKTRTSSSSSTINFRKVNPPPITIKTPEDDDAAGILLAKEVIKWFYDKLDFTKSSYGGMVFDTRGANSYRQNLINKHL